MAEHSSTLAADEAKHNDWLVSVVENLDTSTATGGFVLTMFAALAEMERKQIGEGRKAAIDQLASS